MRKFAGEPKKVKNIDSIADREAYDITLGIINIYN